MWHIEDVVGVVEARPGEGRQGIKLGTGEVGEGEEIGLGVSDQCGD